MKGKPDSRARLLAAAITIVAKDGASHLTIDGVAKESGLSKGGVLYHYPSKHALLQGMMEKMLDELASKSTEARQTDGVSELVAHIRSLSNRSPQERATSLALLANAAEAPSLMDAARPFVNERITTIRAESADEELSLILFLASEGIRFMDVLNLLPLSDSEERDIYKRLQQMAEEAQA